MSCDHSQRITNTFLGVDGLKIEKCTICGEVIKTNNSENSEYNQLISEIVKCLEECQKNIINIVDMKYRK